MKKTSIDNQTQRSFSEFSWEQLIINSYINCNQHIRDKFWTENNSNKNHISFFEHLSKEYVSLSGKSKIGFLNPKNPKTDFAFLF